MHKSNFGVTYKEQRRGKKKEKVEEKMQGGKRGPLCYDEKRGKREVGADKSAGRKRKINPAKLIKARRSEWGGEPEKVGKEVCVESNWGG